LLTLTYRIVSSIACVRAIQNSMIGLRRKRLQASKHMYFTEKEIKLMTSCILNQRMRNFLTLNLFCQQRND